MQEAQTVLEVVVHALTTIEDSGHERHTSQTRSEVGVGAMIWNVWPATQRVRARQTRSEVAVGGETSNWEEVHVVMGAQMRSDVSV